jgi:hypothetical protein
MLRRRRWAYQPHSPSGTVVNESDTPVALR